MRNERARLEPEMANLLVHRHLDRIRAAQSMIVPSPSRWRRRGPVVALATLGFGIATYLSFYQLGIVASVWDPFFAGGSKTVLHSFLSSLLPVPDAVLGAFGCAFEIAAGLIGGTTRYRDQRWIVLVYGAIVFALALAAIALTCVQLFALHAACTLCLCSAAISLVVAVLARDEVMAAGRKSQGKGN
jgi:uncharacterized membrane protein